jgi:hypothetical protein
MATARESTTVGLKPLRLYQVLVRWNELRVSLQSEEWSPGSAISLSLKPRGSHYRDLSHKSQARPPLLPWHLKFPNST